MKKLLISLLLTIVILLALFLTKEYTLYNIYKIIMKYRGTHHYVGETKLTEHILVLKYYILPFTFILSYLSIILFLKFRRKGRKSTLNDADTTGTSIADQRAIKNGYYGN